MLDVTVLINWKAPPVVPDEESFTVVFANYKSKVSPPK